VAHQPVEAHARADQRHEADAIEAREPHARIIIAELGEEHDRGDHEKQKRKGDDEARALAKRRAERLHVIDVGGLQREHAQHGDADRGERVIPAEAVNREHVGEVDRDADRGHEREFDHAHDAGEYDGRERRHDGLRGGQHGGG
jgi:hypothetical protein